MNTTVTFGKFTWTFEQAEQCIADYNNGDGPSVSLVKLSKCVVAYFNDITIDKHNLQVGQHSTPPNNKQL